MLEGKVPGVQHQRRAASAVTVSAVPHHGVAILRELHADLVLASALERRLHERAASAAWRMRGHHRLLAGNLPFRARELAAGVVLDASHEIAFVLHQPAFVESLGRWHRPLHECQIGFLGDLVPVLTQPLHRPFILRHHHHPARLAVKPVHKIDPAGALPLPLAHPVPQHTLDTAVVAATGGLR